MECRGRDLRPPSSKGQGTRRPEILRPAVRAAYFHRLTGLLAVAAQRALAARLLELSVYEADRVDSDPLVMEDVLLDGDPCT